MPQYQTACKQWLTIQEVIPSICRNEKCEFGGVQMTSCIEGQQRIAYHEMRQSIQQETKQSGQGPVGIKDMARRHKGQGP